MMSSYSLVVLEDTRGHHFEVLTLALASDDQVLTCALALVMQVLALALKKRSWPWPWIEAKADTFLRLEKSPEHFQINDANIEWCYRTMGSAESKG